MYNERRSGRNGSFSRRPGEGDRHVPQPREGSRTAAEISASERRQPREHLPAVGVQRSRDGAPGPVERHVRASHCHEASTQVQQHDSRLNIQEANAERWACSRHGREEPFGRRRQDPTQRPRRRPSYLFRRDLTQLFFSFLRRFFVFCFFFLYPILIEYRFVF